MQINFRDVCGEKVTIQLSNNSTVFDACEILKRKLKIQGYEISLISPNPTRNYYQNKESMQDVVKENPEFIIFTKFASYSQKAKNDKQLKQHSTHTYNNLLNLKKAQYFDFIYFEYSNAIRAVPPDFQDKVNQIAELGFLLDDIKEALRETNYNVELAINLIISRNSNEKTETQFKPLFNSFTGFTADQKVAINPFSFSTQISSNFSQKVDQPLSFSFNPQQWQTNGMVQNQQTWSWQSLHQFPQNSNSNKPSQFDFSFGQSSHAWGEWGKPLNDT